MKNIIRVPIERKCKVCGVVYESTASHSSYCSPACRLQYNADYARRWRQKNKEHIREYQREYQRKYGKIQKQKNQDN